MKCENCEDINYFFSKINWANSFIDARAAEIMNNIGNMIKCSCTNPEPIIKTEGGYDKNGMQKLRKGINQKLRRYNS